MPGELSEDGAAFADRCSAACGGQQVRHRVAAVGGCFGQVRQGRASGLPAVGPGLRLLPPLEQVKRRLHTPRCEVMSGAGTGESPGTVPGDSFVSGSGQRLTHAETYWTRPLTSSLTLAKPHQLCGPSFELSDQDFAGAQPEPDTEVEAVY